MTRSVRCSFYERVSVAGGGWHYDRIALRGPNGGDYLVTPWPPVVGDCLFLSDDQRSGLFQVIERQWMHPSWGSTNWPYDKPEPLVGPMLDCIVEPHDGLFVDEVVRPEDEENSSTEVEQ